MDFRKRRLHRKVFRWYVSIDLLGYSIFLLYAGIIAALLVLSAAKVQIISLPWALLVIYFITHALTVFMAKLAPILLFVPSRCLSYQIFQIFVNFTQAILGVLVISFHAIFAFMPQNEGWFHSHSSQETPESDYMQLDGQKVLRGSIRSATSEGNYLRIGLEFRGRKSNILVRATFKEFIDLFGDGEGLVYRRGGWISRKALLRSYWNKGRLYLMLDDGTEVAVSRGYSARLKFL